MSITLRVGDRLPNLFNMDHFIEISTAMNMQRLPIKNRRVAVSDEAITFLLSSRLMYLTPVVITNSRCEYCKTGSADVISNCRNCGAPHDVKIKQRDEILLFGIMWIPDQKLKDLEYEIK